MLSETFLRALPHFSTLGRSVLSRTFELAFLLIATIAAHESCAAGNAVEYSYDAAGNIVQVRRQPVAGLSISGFTPTSGAVGTAVTIQGSGFSATPANNTVQFNGTAATVSAADSGSIAVTVPTGATTGRISVTVGTATATSAQDFVVVVPGAPTLASFSPLSGAAGTTVAATGTNFDAAPGATTVRLNGVVATASVSDTANLSFTVPGAAATGRISATTSGGTGASAADFIVPPPGTNASDIVTTVRLAMDGSAAGLTISTPSRKGLILFDGSADTYYTLQFSQFATSPTSAVISYQVIKPDNTVLASGNVGNNNRPTIHVPKLPMTGTYSVVVSVGSATLNTYVRVATDPVLAVDGPSASSALDFAFQSTRFVFDAAAGQRIGIGVMGLALTPSTGNVSFAAYLPDGATLSSSSLPYCSAATVQNPQANCDGELAATVAGTYTLVAQSPATAYATFSIQLNSEVTGTLAVDTQQDVTLARVGQDARFTFAATSGDSLAIDMSGINPQPQAQSIAAWVYKPDGSTFASCTGTPPAGLYCEMGAVPVTGTYTVTVDPSFGEYGSLKLTLKHGPVLATTDPPTAFAPAAVAETARFRFSGTAGQNLAIGVSGLAYVGTSSAYTNLYVYRPDRSQVGSTVSCLPTVAGGTCKVTLANLPVSGEYSVALVPPAGVKITGNANLSAELTGTLTPGTAVTLDATRPGQNARFTFAGTTGDSTSIKLYAISSTPSGQAIWVTVYKPDGSYLTQGSGSSNGAVILNLASLPATGNYTVVTWPTYGPTWQAQLILDPGTSVAIGGAMVSPATSVAGEPLRYRFDGTAGQRLDFGMTGLTYAAANSSATNLTISRPDGTGIGSLYCYTSGTGACEWSSASLPSTGTYSLVLLPPGSSSIVGGTFALSTPMAGTLVVGDPTQTVAITRPGQTARYTIAGIAAQLLRLNWSSASITGASYVTLSVLKPDGSNLASASVSNGATGGLDLPSLPTTGTYTVVFDPPTAATMSIPVTLVAR